MANSEPRQGAPEPAAGAAAAQEPVEPQPEDVSNIIGKETAPPPVGGRARLGGGAAASSGGGRPWLRAAGCGGVLRAVGYPCVVGEKISGPKFLTKTSFFPCFDPT